MRADVADVADAAVVGFPAVLGVVAGTALQQHIPIRALRFGFAALLVGGLAIGGCVAGVALANAVPEPGLEYGFAALLVFTAYQLIREEEDTDDRDDDG